MEKYNWLNQDLYPFQQHYFKTADGPEMHYVDEGQGEPLVMVHGTPVWSFVWRNLIKSSSSNYRCIAPDHVGFGLSEKPAEGYFTPANHADNLEQLLESLDLTPFTLIVHDFGGPIGLNYAIKHPDKVKKLIILNTWLWPLSSEKSMMQASSFFGSAFGRFLYKHLNFSAKYLLPAAFADKSKLKPEVHQHYLKVFDKAENRSATWQLAKELANSNTWYGELEQKSTALHNIPTLIIWGEKDKLIPKHFLEKWQKLLPKARVEILPSGHFIQEEMPDELVSLINSFQEKE